VIQSADYFSNSHNKTSTLNSFKYKIILILLKRFLCLICFALFLIPCRPQILSPQRIVLHLKDTYLRYDVVNNILTIHAYGDIISQDKNWDIAKPEATYDIYHLRYKKWKDTFWRVDLQANKVYLVKNGHFQNHNKSEIKKAQALQIQVDSEGNPENPTSFILFFSDARLIYEPENKMLKIESQNNIISDGQFWKIKSLKRKSPISTVKREAIIGYHLRRDFWRRLYWEININKNKVYRVKGGTFGKGGGNFKLIDIMIDIEK